MMWAAVVFLGVVAGVAGCIVGGNGGALVGTIAVAFQLPLAVVALVCEFWPKRER